MSPSGAACTQARALSTGRHRGNPNVSEISLPHPNPQGQASQQPLWDRDSRPVLVPPGPLVKSISVLSGSKSCLPPSASLGKSEDMAVSGLVDNPPGSTRIRVGSTGSVPPISTHQSAKPTAANVSDDPSLLVPGQSQDYSMEIVSSRKTSPAGSMASSWVNLDSDSSKQGGSGSNGSHTKAVDMQAKIRQLEKTVPTLQAQL